jgi:hypothetical protein
MGLEEVLAISRELFIEVHIFEVVGCLIAAMSSESSENLSDVGALPKFEDIVAWQIDRRWRISRIMHELHTFLKNEESLHRERNDEWYPVVRMVGIAFSLWRAAFLTHTQGTKKVIYANMVEYLDKVIKHNSIAFADDYKMSDQAAPYYTGNARYRLERMYKYNEKLLQIPSVAAINQLLVDSREEMPQDELWDMCYVALRDCFAAYLDNWFKHVRPRSASKDKPPKASQAGGSRRKRR